MYCFKTPAYSHLTDFLHLEFLYPNRERRVVPRSPLTIQTAPHLPILICLLYLTSTASPLLVLLFSHTSFFPGLQLFSC